MAWTVDSLTYSNRKKITISTTNVDATLADFPVKVQLDADADIGAVCNADGFDLRFTSSDGSTLLKYERESFAVASGEASGIFWVKVTSISSVSDTDIYVYYRATDTADGVDPTNVWDDDFKAVWHSGDGDDTSHINDSTANSHTGTKTGSAEPAEIAGQINKAQHYDNSNDFVQASSSSDFNFGSSGGFTLSAWVKPHSFAAGTAPDYVDDLVSINLTDATNGFYTLSIFGDSGAYAKLPYLAMHYNGADYYAFGSGLSVNTWYFLSAVWNGTSMVCYVDGTAGTPTAQTGINGSTQAINLGSRNANPSGSQYFFDGIMDEVRISATGRSAAWVKFEFYNMDSNAGELTFGAEETPAVGGIKSRIVGGGVL